MGIMSTFSGIFGNMFSRRPQSAIPDQTLLIKEAEKWLGIDETNPGIDNIRKAVNNTADGEPWCVAFVMYCARTVGLRFGKEPSLYMTELAYDLWDKSPKACRLLHPEPGCVVVWNYPGTIRGHAGIVTEVTGNYLHTIEGNTSIDGKSKAPHGVYRRLRMTGGAGAMKILGYLKPFV